jgi:hypothetical protein
VRWNPETDGVDLTTVAGVNNGGVLELYLEIVGIDDPSHWVFQPRFPNERVASHVSAPPPGRPMGLMTMFLTAIHEEGVFSNALNEEPGYNPHRLSSTERESEDPNRSGYDNQGATTERSAGLPPEHVPDDGRINEDANDADCLEKYEGGYQ